LAYPANFWKFQIFSCWIWISGDHFAKINDLVDCVAKAKNGAQITSLAYDIADLWLTNRVSQKLDSYGGLLLIFNCGCSLVADGFRLCSSLKLIVKC
jgi:hypothetical protein